MVMRGWSEFKYLKTKPHTIKGKNEFPERMKISDEAYTSVSLMRTLLSSFHYRILDLQNGMITVLIHPDDVKAAEQIIVENGWRKAVHPYGIETGYKFLYQMKPFKLYKKGLNYIEIYSQIPCASLTSKVWIPLDQEIQRKLWMDEDNLDEMHWANMPCQVIFHLCWAVFFNNGFSLYERKILSDNMNCVLSTEVINLLKPVFFGFTERIIDLLKLEEYDRIVAEYYSFCDY